MSIEFFQNNEYALSRYDGDINQGVMLQIAAFRESDGFGYIQLTRKDVKFLRKQLKEFLKKA